MRAGYRLLLYVAPILIFVTLVTLFRFWPPAIISIAAVSIGALMMAVLLAIVRRRRDAPPVAAVPGGLERTADTPRDQPVIPAELPPPGLLVGRDDTLAELRAHLSTPAEEGTGPRLIVLYGDRGVGKTALAINLAHQVAEDYPDGQLLFRFDRADVTTPEERLGVFVWALKGPKERMPDPADLQRWYRERTQRRRVLVILDNVETVEQIQPLLPAGPDCLAVVTATDELTPLREPFPHLRSVPVAPLTPPDATRLLRELIGVERISEEDSPQAARIVVASGGYPVALSIAGAVLASRRNWTLEVAVRRMDEAAAASPGGTGVPFSGILDLAYALLTRTEQNALLLLGLADTHQVQPWLLAALLRGQHPEEASSPGLAARLLDRLALARFAERQVEDDSGVSTYTLPWYAQAYATGRLRAEPPPLPVDLQQRIRGELRNERDRRAARDVERQLRQTVYQQLDEGRINQALESARELLAWSRDDDVRRADALVGRATAGAGTPGGTPAAGGTTAPAGAGATTSLTGVTAPARVRESLALVALGEVVAEFGWIDAAAAYAREARNLSGDSPLVRARALRLSGSLRLGQRQIPEAETELDEALDAVGRTGDEGEHIRVLREQIVLQALRGDPARGRRFAKIAESMTASGSGAARRERPGILLAHGVVEQMCGDPDRARELFTEAEKLTADPAAHQELRCCWIRLQHARLLLQEEKYDQSREFAVTALSGFTKVEHRYGAGHARLELGRAYLAEENLERAVPLLEESHGTFRRCGDRWIMTDAATALAQAYHLADRVQEATALLRAARQTYTRVGDAYGQWLAGRLLWEVESDLRDEPTEPVEPAGGPPGPHPGRIRRAGATTVATR
ncbi:AAA family ATPase [Plantactinospora sp. B24E8]|uniref:AAA family ATPase n=1 Tax=Plantactinospora sp. B24E8 TaxID=3153567 RepID=UPI00325D7455